ERKFREQAEPQKKRDCFRRDAAEEKPEEPRARRIVGEAHGVFKKELPGHRAKLRQQHAKKSERTHSFSSSRTSGRATTAMPAITSAMPSQRLIGIVSPKKI